MAKSTNFIPVEIYGVLTQDDPTSEFDEVAEQVRRIGYAVLNSGYTLEELTKLSKVFNTTRATYVNKYGETRLRCKNELNTIRAPLTYGDPAFISLAANQNLLRV